MTKAGGKTASTNRDSTSAKKRLKSRKLVPSQAPAAQSTKQPSVNTVGSNFTQLACPECSSQFLWKDGLRYLTDGTVVQRFLCRNCGFRFSESRLQGQIKFNISRQLLKGSNSGKGGANTSIFDGNFPVQNPSYKLPLSTGEYVGSHDASIVEEDLNALCSYNRRRRVCVSETEAKNLAEVESRNEKQAAGATEKFSNAEVKGKIVEYLWYLKKQGYAASTVETYVRIIKILHRNGANLYDPESVKKVIALQNWSKGRKWNAVKAYSLFLKMRDLTWDKPRYKPVEKLPFIPTEREIDDLTAACSKQISTFLQLLKETGARLGEAFNLKWTDIDLVSRTIRITPEKGSEPRIFCISEKLATMIGCLPKTSSRIWAYKSARNVEREFRRERKRIAHKLGNPRILQIHFHTLRHWKATIEYAKTKDILYVQKLLGHKSLKTTLRYTQLVNYPHAEEYVCKVAKTVDEVKELVEAGFEYVTDMEGVKLFKKLKTSYLGTAPSPSIGPVV